MKIYLPLVFVGLALCACSEVEKYRKYILPNLQICLDIYESQMTYQRAKQCALEKCAYVKEKYGVEFSNENCEKFMNELLPDVKKKYGKK